MKMNSKVALTVEGLQGLLRNIQGELPTVEVFINFHKTGSIQKDELIHDQEAEG